MHKFSRFVRPVAVGAASALAAVATMAQSTTTAPTSASALASSIQMSDAQNAGLIIVAALVAVGVVLWGARLVMSKFRPRI